MQRKIALIGYDEIGKKVAVFIARQDDVEVIGVCDVISDWRIQTAIKKGFPVYAATERYQSKDATGRCFDNRYHYSLVGCGGSGCRLYPKEYSCTKCRTYKERKMKFILQEGEKHRTTSHSFNRAEKSIRKTNESLSK
ncbi:hypothetical protein [Ekhidna sp.]|uniref:hypothetical protein n=1 Tax=Ekhidna sp. TaxID=2608089 RepID=UPI003CCB8CF0